MMHKHRRWTIERATSIADLARKLTYQVWRTHKGFELSDYWFLNDSVSMGTAQVYVAVRKPGIDDPPLSVDRITFSRLDFSAAVTLITMILKRGYINRDWAYPVAPAIEYATDATS